MAANVNDELCGAEVASVEFVRDYVQLHLEAPSHEQTPFGPAVRPINLTAVTDPIVDAGGRRYDKDTPGWRDALCHLIGKVVTRAEAVPGSEFRMESEGGLRFVVPLDEESRAGPEALVISGTETWVF